MIPKCVMMIGSKESFFIKVLVKKIQGSGESSGIEAGYVPASKADITAKWDKCGILTYYMESGEVIDEALIRFLAKKLEEGNKQLILVGEAADTAPVLSQLPKDRVYKVFDRPLDNDEYIQVVTEFFNRDTTGETRKSVLIIDDDTNYMGLVRQWLKVKYKVSMACSGQQAFKWFENNTADLILLDFEMPDVSGPQVLKMLHDNESTRDIPVFFLTGRTDLAGVSDSNELNCIGFLQKTIGQDELLKVIADFFGSNN
ncbi:response regulator [Butyrivibrio sp. DSM 10294]|uniref:response regulator n=1 Tax=Butyrivibrio sp. DSM 10294 TaxID=2972457 RepID=UPI00234ED173|nr:response regulator [Butyrivibrio sp. DSM 10294]MDC7293896.1 response regulator [Butyrivibrio sp. DSM 10294]